MHLKLTNKNFKFDSPIYRYLNILIKYNPINVEIQRKIDKFLLEYTYNKFYY